MIQEVNCIEYDKDLILQECDEASYEPYFDPLGGKSLDYWMICRDVGPYTNEINSRISKILDVQCHPRYYILKDNLKIVEQLIYLYMFYHSQLYGIKINYYKEYIGSVEIYQLNEKDERTYGCKLEECFPITIGALPYGHGNNNVIQTISVEFAYRYWRNIATEPQRANLDSTLQDILKNSVIRNVQSRIPQVVRSLFPR